MSYEEELLPHSLLQKRVSSSGISSGWKYQDIPLVANTCRDFGLAILDGQAEFLFPESAGKLYWIRVRLELKHGGESWQIFSGRTCSEIFPGLTALIDKTDLVKEAMAYDFLKSKVESLVNILDHLCFELNIVSESRYLSLYR